LRYSFCNSSTTTRGDDNFEEAEEGISAADIFDTGVACTATPPVPPPPPIQSDDMTLDTTFGLMGVV